MKHNSLPWTINEDGEIECCGSILGRMYGIDDYPCLDLEEEDTVELEEQIKGNWNLVTRACNSHYDLLEACEAMIKISDLWLPVRALHPEHEGELKALCEAKRKLEAAIQKAKAE